MPTVCKLAKVAVSSANFTFDKPFEYRVPPELGDVAPGDRVLVPFGKRNAQTGGFVLSVSESGEAKKVKDVLYVYRDGLRLTEQELELAYWMRSRYFASFFDCADAMLPPGVWEKLTERYAPVPGARPDWDKLTQEDAAVLSALFRSEEPLTLRRLEQQTELDDLPKRVRALADDGLLRILREQSGSALRQSIKAVRPRVGALPEPKRMGRGDAAARRMDALAELLRAGQLPEKELCYRTGAKTADISWLVKNDLVERFALPRYLTQTPESAAAHPFILSKGQKAVYDGVLRQMEQGTGCALLHGVTGSGKTAVYIELIRRVIREGRSALMLVPEIALTPQMLRVFRSHFGAGVAVLHSGLSDSERYDEYMRVRTGRAKVVVGTRSAVFAPCENLGLIIIDEEHETSYRSDSGVRYSAAEIAKYRCAASNCLLLLGSATPSVETYYGAEQGRYSLYTLEERFSGVSLPQTIVADMKQTLKDGDGASLGPALREEMRKNLDRGEQTILFINRRGNARMAMCADCGYVPECENCTVSLTYHSANGRLMCHHCGYSIPLISVCPQCGGSHIKLVGAGTQKIEEEIAELLPEARVLRMDADTTTGRRSHEEILDAFGRGEADILLGTQMVAKGLDFPNVTLVGVVDADLSMNSSSYIAGERSFSLISQVVGRAGRRDKPGRAVIQTYSPKSPIITAASAQDYLSFYRYELEVRELTQAPPFSDVFTLLFSGEDEAHVSAAAQLGADAMRRLLETKYPAIASPVLGPAPAAIARLNNKYRCVVTLKGRETGDHRRMLRELLLWLSGRKELRGITVAADRNAYYY